MMKQIIVLYLTVCLSGIISVDPLNVGIKRKADNDGEAANKVRKSKSLATKRSVSASLLASNYQLRNLDASGRVHFSSSRLFHRQLVQSIRNLKSDSPASAINANELYLCERGSDHLSSSIMNCLDKNNAIIAFKYLVNQDEWAADPHLCTAIQIFSADPKDERFQVSCYNLNLLSAFLFDIPMDQKYKLFDEMFGDSQRFEAVEKDFKLSSFVANIDQSKYFAICHRSTIRRRYTLFNRIYCGFPNDEFETMILEEEPDFISSGKWFCALRPDATNDVVQMKCFTKKSKTKAIVASTKEADNTLSSDSKTVADVQRGDKDGLKEFTSNEAASAVYLEKPTLFADNIGNSADFVGPDILDVDRYRILNEIQNGRLDFGFMLKSFRHYSRPLSHALNSLDVKDEYFWCNIPQPSKTFQCHSLWLPTFDVTIANNVVDHLKGTLYCKANLSEQENSKWTIDCIPDLFVESAWKAILNLDPQSSDLLHQFAMDEKAFDLNYWSTREHFKRVEVSRPVLNMPKSFYVCSSVPGSTYFVICTNDSELKVFKISRLLGWFFEGKNYCRMHVNLLSCYNPSEEPNRNGLNIKSSHSSTAEFSVDNLNAAAMHPSRLPREEYGSSDQSILYTSNSRLAQGQPERGQLDANRNVLAKDIPNFGYVEESMPNLDESFDFFPFDFDGL